MLKNSIVVIVSQKNKRNSVYNYDVFRVNNKVVDKFTRLSFLLGDLIREHPLTLMHNWVLFGDFEAAL
jgi:hypothetical protein